MKAVNVLTGKEYEVTSVKEADGVIKVEIKVGKSNGGSFKVPLWFNPSTRISSKGAYRLEGKTP